MKKLFDTIVKNVETFQSSRYEKFRHIILLIIILFFTLMMLCSCNQMMSTNFCRHETTCKVYYRQSREIRPIIAYYEKSRGHPKVK
jgi:hypothetical protein